jgi:hypothetical protein
MFRTVEFLYVRNSSPDRDPHSSHIKAPSRVSSWHLSSFALSN